MNRVLRLLFDPWLTALAAAAALASPFSAGVQIQLSKPAYDAGETAVLAVQGGTPGDKGFLLIGSSTGSTQVPGLGEVLIALDEDFLALPMPPFPPSGAFEFKCNFPCDSAVVNEPCYFQVVTLNPAKTAFTGISNVAVLVVLAANCGECAEDAVADPQYYPFPHKHAFWLPGIGEDFVFDPAAQFSEFAGGTAKLTGVIARKSNPSKRFLVDVDFANPVYPGAAGFPPPGSPKKELDALAYAENGGPVNPANWHYYQSTAGTLVGLESYKGAMLSIADTGPAFQVGIGANGKNAELGASGWIHVTTLKNPSSGATFPKDLDGDINMNFGGDCTLCALKAAPDPKYSTSKFTHSFYLPPLGTDFVFTPPGTYVEYGDGTARLTGTIKRTSDPDEGFTVDVEFRERVNPGAPSYPPSGSPKKSLSGSAYTGGGGPIDTDLWHYFQVTEGLLTGIGDYAGAAVKVTRDGPSFQVGLGANDKNLEYGASGWLLIQVLSHPTSGPFPPDFKKGDINIELERCP